MQFTQEIGLVYTPPESEQEILGNFYPELLAVYDSLEGKKAVIDIHFQSGNKFQITVPVNKLRRCSWFEWCPRCLVNEDIKEANAIISRFMREQVAQYESNMEGITQYEHLGWNTGPDGKKVFVSGNHIIGGKGKEIIAEPLKECKLEVDGEEENSLKCFADLYRNAPLEALIAILYFFTGLLRQLFKDAGVPVDFGLYMFGEQQNRKTSLARQTNSLYNRSTDMDFNIRTVEKTTVAAAEKLMDFYKDSTLIFDDVCKSGNKEYQQNQENIVEHVIRTIGNRARKSSNSGNHIREYMPNANVVFTGEYLPRFPESVLSRMLIVEIRHPVDSIWLEEFGMCPQMLSTVAYSFLAWVQPRYDKWVKAIRDAHMQYRKIRNREEVYQDRIQEHGFIMQCTSSILCSFLDDKGYETSLMGKANVEAIQQTLERQSEIMRKTALRDTDKDFCRVLAELYMQKKLYIAKDGTVGFKDSDYDGFEHGKHIVCITPGKLCAIMRHYYNDTSITVQSITKQLKANRLLATDASGRSTKKVQNTRYVHIWKEVLKEYYEYCT